MMDGATLTLPLAAAAIAPTDAVTAAALSRFQALVGRRTQQRVDAHRADVNEPTDAPAIVLSLAAVQALAALPRRAAAASGPAVDSAAAVAAVHRALKAALSGPQTADELPCAADSGGVSGDAARGSRRPHDVTLRVALVARYAAGLADAAVPASAVAGIVTGHVVACVQDAVARAWRSEEMNGVSASARDQSRATAVVAAVKAAAKASVAVMHGAFHPAFERSTTSADAAGPATAAAATEQQEGQDAPAAVAALWLAVVTAAFRAAAAGIRALEHPQRHLRHNRHQQQMATATTDAPMDNLDAQLEEHQQQQLNQTAPQQLQPTLVASCDDAHPADAGQAVWAARGVVFVACALLAASSRIPTARPRAAAAVAAAVHGAACDASTRLGAAVDALGGRLDAPAALMLARSLEDLHAVARRQ